MKQFRLENYEYQILEIVYSLYYLFNYLVNNKFNNFIIELQFLKTKQTKKSIKMDSIVKKLVIQSFKAVKKCNAQ